MSLGKHLSQVRKAAGLSQMDVAEKIGISHHSVSKWEKDVARPDIRMAKRLAVIYGCTLDELLGYTEEIIDTADFKITKRDQADTYPILGTYPQEIDVRQVKAALEAIVEHVENHYDYRPRDAVMVLQDLLSQIETEEETEENED